MHRRWSGPAMLACAAQAFSTMLVIIAAREGTEDGGGVVMAYHAG